MMDMGYLTREANETRHFYLENFVRHKIGQVDNVNFISLRGKAEKNLVVTGTIEKFGFSFHGKNKFGK